MKNFSPLALLLALPLGIGAASAQSLQSSVTSFDGFGNPVIQYTSPSDADYAANGLRSSVTSFGPNGVPRIQYTSPPLNPTGITQPASIAGLLANQNLYGQSAPAYGGYGYNPYPYGGAGYGGAGYGYGYGYGYNAPTYPYTIPLDQSRYGFNPPASLTVIPLPSANAYPAPGYPYGAGYGVPAYPAPGYAYPPGYGYPYGGVNSSYHSQSTGYGVRFGVGGARFSIGGNNASGSTNTTVIRR